MQRIRRRWTAHRLRWGLLGRWLRGYVLILAYSLVASIRDDLGWSRDDYTDEGSPWGADVLGYMAWLGQRRAERRNLRQMTEQEIQRAWWRITDPAWYRAWRARAWQERKLRAATLKARQLYSLRIPGAAVDQAADALRQIGQAMHEYRQDRQRARSIARAETTRAMGQDRPSGE